MDRCKGEFGACLICGNSLEDHNLSEIINEELLKLKIGRPRTEPKDDKHAKILESKRNYYYRNKETISANVREYQKKSKDKTSKQT